MEKREKRWFLAAVNGDSLAFHAIFTKYQPVVLSLRKKYFLKGMDLDDWLQEGRIICYQSLKKFDHDKGISFGYFFKLNLERHIFSLLRKQEAAKRKADKRAVSLDEKLEQFGEHFNGYGASLTTKSLDGVLIRDRLRTFHTQLSRFEAEIFNWHVTGKTHDEIATDLDCSIEKVKNGLDRTKSKLKKYLSY